VASPLWPRFDKAIADETNAIIARQVSPWAHLKAPSGQPLVVHRFDGSAMSWPGGKFEGAPQQAFWRGYIEPFLEKMVVEQLRAAGQAAKDGGVDAAELIGEVEALLLAACRKVYDRMADVDARLRAEGYADTAARRSIKRELRAVEEFIHKHATTTAALAAIASPRIPTFGEYLRRYQFLVVLLVLLLVVAGLFVTR
jgi:hypothetical protein